METVQAACNKCANGEKQHNPIARNEILFGSQFAGLCVPFLMHRMRYSLSVNLRTKRKCVPDNAHTGTKVTKRGHFFDIVQMGILKNANMGITMRGQILCAYGL